MGSCMSFLDDGIYNCPICKKKPMSYCGCKLRDVQCPNKHTYFKCLICAKRNVYRDLITDCKKLKCKYCHPELGQHQKCCVEAPLHDNT